MLSVLQRGEELVELGLNDESIAKNAWANLERVTHSPLERISIEPDEMSDGVTARLTFLQGRDLKGKVDRDLRELVEAEVEAYVAGYVAQKILDPKNVEENAWGFNDASEIMSLLQDVAGDDYVAVLKKILDRAEKTLRQPKAWEAVQAVACALLKRKTLGGREGEGIIY